MALLRRRHAEARKGAVAQRLGALACFEARERNVARLVGRRHRHLAKLEEARMAHLDANVLERHRPTVREAHRQPAHLALEQMRRQLERLDLQQRHLARDLQR